MKLLQRAAALALVLMGALFSAGCTTTAIVVMHVVDQLTEGMPVACHKLNSVDRALQPRCGDYMPGSLATKDVAAPGLPTCPLAVAASNAQLWPVLPELIAKGSVPERCAEPPLVVLARASGGCADFGSASAASRDALRWLAEADPRSVHPDVVRLLSCPSARHAGLDSALDRWLAMGWLAPGQVGFAPLGALHPSHLHSSLAARLEAQGHRARDALGGQRGALGSGFEEALRSGDTLAIDWWIDRVPGLARLVPASDPAQMSWVPLARALTPAYLPDPARREQTVMQLLARGADPAQRLPHDRRHTVLDFARQIRSPLVPMLEAHSVRSAAGLAPGLPVAASVGAAPLRP